MSTDSLSNSPSPEHELEGQKDRPGSGIVIDGISYIPSSVLLTGIPKVSFKDNQSFAVVDTLGESPRIYSASSELGFYFRDTRYLQTWEMTFNGARPVALAHELRHRGATVVFSMTNRDFPRIGDGAGRIPRDTFLFRKIIAIHRDVVFETVEIKNFGSEAHSLQVEQWAGGRFDDVFEVRGFVRPKRGRMLAPQDIDYDGERYNVLQYEGLDGRLRRVFIRRYFDAEKIRMSPALVGQFARVEIPPKGTIVLKTVISFDEPSDATIAGQDFGELNTNEMMTLLAAESELHPFHGLEIVSDNAIVNRSIEHAKTDIFMLLTQEEGKGPYPYAGIPWFSAPFGRDGIITAYQMLPWFPRLAYGVLDFAFQMLGSREDAFTDEQPGKVFHEMRHGEMARTREIPFIPYYGSVDSTPLCLILLHEYVRWTMDLESLRRWWPEALRAMAWIEKWGDSDGDGFLEYARRSATGLVNQGWKDSHDSIMHSNGALAEAPIRLCEVQGYAFRARLAMSALARLLGNEGLASRLRLEALQLRVRFMERFWDYQRQYVYLALDGDSKPCQVISSNMGHCLWSELLEMDQARAVTRHLMSSEMFSGFGIRTLSSGEVSYNPMSYHNGSVWPHDNSLIMEGFRNYGHVHELETLARAMIGILETSGDFRLPELFCGFKRRGSGPPVPYEVACKPQAWAAGSVFLMIRSLLGISMDADQNHLVLSSPILTSKISNLEVRGFKGRDWELDLLFHRGKAGTTVEVKRRSGSVRVLTVK